MKILVMGSGAVGGYYGAVLHRGGHEVTFVARGEHLEAIRQNGLRVESVTSGDFTIHPLVTDRPDGSWTPDWALFCVKGYDNAAAIELMRPAVREGTSILTLQNGLGSGDELASAFGQEKVLLGVTYVDAVRKAPGVVVEEGGPCNIIFGEADGSRFPRAVAVYETMKASGISVELSSDVEAALWSKLIYVCAWSGMICITRASFAEILGTPDTEELTWRVMREAEAVARAKGVNVDGDLVERTMERFRATDGPSISSMYEDLKRGGRLEVGVLNGAVARLGKELGVETPVNGFIAACLMVVHNRAVAARP